MPELSLNGKSFIQKGLIQVILILSLAAYIAIDKLSGKDASAEFHELTQERIVRLEECVKRLQNVPEDIASLKVETRHIQATLDKIEKKIDSQK